MQGRFPRALAGVVVLAVLLRAGVVLLGPDLPLTADAGDYDRHARSIAAGDGYPETAIAAPGTPSALRPPAYPYWLGAIYALTGGSADAARLAGALLGGLTVLLAALVARRVWGDRPALGTAVLVAVAPALVYVNGSLVSEQLFLPLVLGVVLVVQRARDAPGVTPPLWLAAAAGALCGLAALTRVVGIVLVAAAVAGLWRGRSRRALAAPAVAVLAAVLVLAPWAVRNAVVFDRAVPLATQEGFNLYGTYNEVAEAATEHPANWRFPLELPGARDLFFRPGWDEARISAELGARARAFALDHPGYVARVAFWNAARMLRLAEQPYDDVDYAQTGIPPGARGVVEAGVALTFLGGLAGGVLLLVRRRPAGPPWLWLVPVLLALPVVLFVAAPRYRLPLDPFLLMLAAAGLGAASRSPQVRGDVRHVGLDVREQRAGGG